MHVSQKVSNFLQGSWNILVTMWFCSEPQNTSFSIPILHCSMCYSMIKITRPKWLVIQNKKVQLSSKANIAPVFILQPPLTSWAMIHSYIDLLGSKIGLIYSKTYYILTDFLLRKAKKKSKCKLFPKSVFSWKKKITKII